MILPTKAISIRQPWCQHILYDGKDVENRTWPTRYRGPVLIHASKGIDAEDRETVREFEMPRGGIVGIMTITGCVTDLDSEWFFGPYGFLIRDARPLPFVPCRGMLGFFDVPADAMAELRRLTGEP